MKIARTLLLVGSAATAVIIRAQGQTPATTDTAQHEIYGTVDSITGSRLVVRTRTGHRLDIDGLPALTAHRSTLLFVGRLLDVVGTFDAAGVLHAKSLWTAHLPKDTALWPPDR